MEQLAFDNGGKRSAGGRWSIVGMLFDQESWKRRGRRHHTGTESGGLLHCNSGHRRSPTKCIPIQMLPHRLRRVRLNRRRVGSCTAESSGRQRNDERKHDNTDQRPPPPRHRTSRHVSCFRFHPDNLRLIIQITYPKAMLPSTMAPICLWNRGCNIPIAFIHRGSER